MGYLAAVKRFLKVMAMEWAGSQVTKLVRAGGALALAPTVDRGLSWFTVKFKFDSQVKFVVASFPANWRRVAPRLCILEISFILDLLSYALWKTLSSWTARDTHGWDAKHYTGINLA